MDRTFRWKAGSGSIGKRRTTRRRTISLSRKTPRSMHPDLHLPHQPLDSKMKDLKICGVGQVAVVAAVA